MKPFPRHRTAAVLLALALGAGSTPAWGEPETLPQLRTVTGEILDPQTLFHRGPVLLDFWATWCRPCLASIPEIQAIYARYRDRGLTVIGVSIDGPRNYAKVRPFAQRLGVTFPVVFDREGDLQRRFRVNAIPTAVLIGPDGLVESVQEGYRPGDEGQLEGQIARLLPRTAASRDTAAADSLPR